MALYALGLVPLRTNFPIQKLIILYWKVGTMASLLLLAFLYSKWLRPKLHNFARAEKTKDRHFKSYSSGPESIFDTPLQFVTNDGQELLRQQEEKDARKPSWANPSYVLLPPPEAQVILGSPASDPVSSIASEASPDDPMTEYFETLRKPTGFCKKLARIGGNLRCSPNLTSPVMDGHKNVCLDPEFQIGGYLTNTTDCLVLSFGIGRETSFDEAARRANCEVHMFDTLNFSPDLARNDKFVHFHKYGLGAGRTIIYVKSNGMMVDVDNYSNIIYNLGLVRRLVNILKIDIEAAEWSVLENMLLGDFMDTIGQIAIEVHAFDPGTMKNIYQMSEYKRLLGILKRLEEKGFRRVSYWDTISFNPKRRIQTKMQRSFEHAGELLLVNTNWYNKEFRRQGKLSGFNFISV